jgi:hypothetical protein
MMYRIVIVILIYHRHKPIDNVNLLGSCLIKHAETLLRTKDCCTHSLLHAQQDALTHNKTTELS